MLVKAMFLDVEVQDRATDGHLQDDVIIFRGRHYDDERHAQEELRAGLQDAPLQFADGFDPDGDRPTTIFNISFRDTRTGHFVSYKKLPIPNSLIKMLDDLPRYL